MKYPLIITSLLLLTLQTAYGQQTNSQNYILSRTFKQAGASVNDLSKVDIQLQYIDGLGRPLQEVSVGQSPTGLDMVKPIEYDALGRQAKDYLLYVASGNGSYKSNALSAIGTWYTSNSAGLQSADLSRPYTETFFEQTPSGRPEEQRAPGNKSANATITYSVNASGAVKRYDYNGGTNAIVQNGNYTAGTLRRRQTTDEEGKVMHEFTDKQGQLVCKKIIASGSDTLSTYYVYDDQGWVRAVLQPAYQDNASTADNAFLYDYDERGRIIGKKIPGAGAIEYVYDKFDRLVLSRDANQLTRGVWGFSKYDALNRPVVTGEIASTDNRTTWATNVSTITEHHEERDNGATAGYSLDKTAPTTADESSLLTILFYDDYSFSKASGLAYSVSYYPSNNATVIGQQTGGRKRILPGNGSAGSWLTYVTYYDAEYRPIQTVRELYDLGSVVIERVSTQYRYDLAAVTSEEKTEQLFSGTVTNARVATFSYDHNDRLLDVRERVIIGSKTKQVYTLAQRYNALGQLQNKWYHSSDGYKYRHRTDYTYNIRGWLTEGKTVYKEKVSDPEKFVYAFSLAYVNGGNYTNGNISSMQWLRKDETSYLKGMDFSYDGANRLAGSSGLGGYADTESGFSYDKNGNIKTLVRAGSAVDNLTYTYSGNRLSQISDASGNNSGVKNGTSSYSYDGNGNLTSDGNRGANITYNSLNLPKTVAIGANTMSYDYDASGSKHKYVTDTLTIKYAGLFEHNQSNVVKRVNVSGGQAIPSGDTIRFDYSLTDHLGNVRLVFDESGKILQQTDYYPFGLEIDRNNPGQTQAARNGVNRYLFQGQEKQVGSDYVQFKWRLHDPSTGRFLSVDPLSEDYQHNSTYAFSENKVTNHIELEGTEAIPAQGYLYDAAGFSHQLNDKENSDLAKKLLEMWIEAYAKVTIAFVPVENVLVGGAAVLAKQLSLALRVEALLVKEAAAAKAAETFYRSMTKEAAEIFLSTGKIPAGTETFVSPTKSFAQNYNGILFEINVKPATLSQLEGIGVRNSASGHPYSHLPLVERGWKGSNAFFKVEGTQVNIGLGNGKALNIFNSNIRSFRVIR